MLQAEFIFSSVSRICREAGRRFTLGDGANELGHGPTRSWNSTNQHAEKLTPANKEE